MKLTISTTKDAIKDGGAGLNFIAEEGIFPLALNFVSVEATKNGAKQANFNVQYKGNSQTINGPIIVNRDENINAIGMSLLNKLGVIVGLSDGEDLDIEEETHNVGKDDTPRTFDVITNFSDEEVYLHVVREYSRYEGKISGNLVIRNAFRGSDTASAAEIAGDVAPEEIGKQHDLTLEKYCVPSYKDGVTPEEAEAFEDKKRAERTSKKGGAPSPTSAVVNKKAKAFGSR
jgi:hypothetical protein